MIHETFSIQMEGSQPYARLVTYIQDYSHAMQIQKRKLVLLCPGGGYSRTSDREAESMALQFMAMGYLWRIPGLRTCKESTYSAGPNF